MISFKRCWILRRSLSNMIHRVTLTIILNQLLVILHLQIHKCKLHTKVLTTTPKIHILKINFTRKITKVEAAKTKMEPSTRPTWSNKMYLIILKSQLGQRTSTSRKINIKTKASSATTCMLINEKQDKFEKIKF